jgi:serine-type D-Ala-D-Ala carboxypeptidase/endopeptidase (penicillin-binding protein 4)
VFLKATVALSIAAWVLAATELAATPRPRFSQTDIAFPALRKLSTEEDADVSALAVNLGDPHVIWGMNAGRRLAPASLSKLYVAAAALQRWGPNKSFGIRLLAVGSMHNGILRGSLTLLGDGAPALTDAELLQLAKDARNAGLRRVVGDLIVNESKFGRVACAIQDRCKARRVSGHAYEAPLSAAGVNFNTWCLEIRPRLRAGPSARVMDCTATLGAPIIEGHIKTVAPTHGSQFIVTRVREAGEEKFQISGVVPAASPIQRVYRAVANPSMHTAILLRQALRGAGIRVTGANRVSYEPPHGRPLAAVNGQWLRQLLPSMLAYSNNYMADVLTLDLGADAGLPIPIDLKASAGVLSNLAARADQRTWFARPENPRPKLLSGSGLSINSQVSALSLVALLDAMYRRPALFPSFVGALTVPVYSPFTFLHQSNGPWSTRTMVKTGSLHQPVTVLDIAGYVRLRDGGWGTIAIVINGSAIHPKLDMNAFMNAIQHDMNQLLMSY